MYIFNPHVGGGGSGEDGKSAYQIWLDLGNTGDEAAFIASLAGEDGEDATSSPQQIHIPLGGQYFLDVNEINGWGVIGPIDDTNNQDLGNSDANTLSANAGGLSFPFDVRIVRMDMWWSVNNSTALPFGWLLSKVTKASNSTVTTLARIIDEIANNGGTPPNAPGNTRPQYTTYAPDHVLEAGHILNLAAVCPAGATDTNRYARIMSGFILVEKVESA